MSSGSDSTADGPRQDAVRVYRRLLRYAWPYRWVFLAGVVGMFVGAASEAGFAALLKPLVDDGFVGRDPDTIRAVPLVLVMVFIARGLSGFVDGYCVHWVGRKVIYDLRGAMFARMVRLPSRFYDRHSTAGLVAKLIYDVEQVGRAVTSAVRVVIKDSFLVLALLTWLLILNWQLTLVFLAVAPLIGWIAMKISHRFQFTSTRIQGTIGSVTHVARESFQGHQVVKAFGGYATEEKRFDQVNRENRRFSMRKAVVSAASVPLMMLVSGIAVAIIIHVALQGVGGALITPGTFVSYLGAAMLLQAPIKRLARVNESIQTGIAAARSIFEVIDLESETRGGPRDAGVLKGRLSLQNVHFRYPDDDEPVLNGLSFDVEPGQTIALVGSSGGGKSTIVSLLLRFYDCQRGSIHIDDRPIEEYSIESLRRNVAVVTQSDFLFDGTIAENIGYARDAVDERDLKAAADIAQVSSFAKTLADGLDSGVGEQGRRLSGGQRQRVVIARALYRQAPILILDEATSALDNRSERLVRDAIDALAGERTIIVIAHRLSTVVNADCIHVIDKGRIVESGVHAELAAREGVYKKLLTRR